MAANLVELLGTRIARIMLTHSSIRLRYGGFVKNSLGSGPNTFQVCIFLTKYQAALPTVIQLLVQRVESHISTCHFGG